MSARRATRLTMDGDAAEAQVQRAVLAYLAHAQRAGRVAWFARMNTGAGRLVGKDGKPGRFIRFGFQGCPDVLGQLPDGRLLAIEIKRGNPRLGQVRPEQQAFLARAAACGAVAGVVRSIDDLDGLVPG